MRILFLSSEVVPERAGGIATYVATIAPALAARGHDVHVLSCAPEHIKRDDHSDGVWWHRRRLPGGFRISKLRRWRQSALWLSTAIACRRELPKLGVSFDVIESGEWMAESLLVGLTTKTPVVVNLHSPLYLLFSFDVPRLNADLRIADAMERTAVRRARMVTSTSSLLTDKLRGDGWLRSTPSLVRYPVTLDGWEDTPPAGEAPPNILVVGRLEPRKAPEVVIEAAALLRADVPDVEVTFVGRSKGRAPNGQPYAEWLADLSEQRCVRANFVGQVPHPETRALYSRSRAVAVASHFESFSIAALEGMASSRPVVYSSRIGAAEVLRGTQGGTEVPPGDARALADGLRPYLMQPQLATDAGRAARHAVHEQCRPDVIAQQRERCFEEAVRMSA